MAIKKCEPCKPHEFQDEKYGKNMRVANPLRVPPGMPPRYVCTVCGKETKS